MKIINHSFESLRLQLMAVATASLLGNMGCTDIYEGPIIPEEPEHPFSGSVGTETVTLDGGQVIALGGLVKLTYGKCVPPEPYEIFVATFPVNHLNLEGYNSTGRGYYLAFSSEGYEVEVELRYDKERLKSTMDNFREEDLAIYRVITEASDIPAEENAIRIGPCEVDTDHKVVRGSINMGGTFVLVQD
jgi:hypothetical protein